MLLLITPMTKMIRCIMLVNSSIWLLKGTHEVCWKGSSFPLVKVQNTTTKEKFVGKSRVMAGSECHFFLQSR